jgi:hypothetical protein
MGLPMNDYRTIPSLSEIVLEESYVLDVVARPGMLSLFVDAVLTSRHSDYLPPSPDVQECYRKGEIKFTGLDQVVWKLDKMSRSTDATGESDYGNVDTFRYAGNEYQFEGEFGRISLTASKLEVLLSSPR